MQKGSRPSPHPDLSYVVCSQCGNEYLVGKYIESLVCCECIEKEKEISAVHAVDKVQG